MHSIEKLTFPMMRFWSFVKTANYFGLSRIIGLKCWWNCRNASVLGMIRVKGSDKLAFVQGGRAVQRLWLQVALEGLALQPIIGLTLLINRLKHNELSCFTANQVKMVKNAEQRLPKILGISESETLIMGFRLGYASAIKTKTKRRKALFKY